MWEDLYACAHIIVPDSAEGSGGIDSVTWPVYLINRAGIDAALAGTAAGHPSGPEQGDDILALRRPPTEGEIRQQVCMGRAGAALAVVACQRRCARVRSLHPCPFGTRCRLREHHIVLTSLPCRHMVPSL